MYKLAALAAVNLIALVACAPQAAVATPLPEEDFYRATHGWPITTDEWMVGILPSYQLTVDGQPAVLVVISYQALQEGLGPHPAYMLQPGYQPKLITTHGKLVDPWLVQPIDCWPSTPSAPWADTFLFVTECRDSVPGIRGVLLLFLTDQQPAGVHFWLESLIMYFSSVP